MILATLAEFSYIPTTWNNTSHLTRRLLFLLVTLALTAGPTFYIAVVENQTDGGASLALILGIAQFFISVVAALLFGIMPSATLSCTQARLGSVFLWFLVFGCKFTESYLFLTLASRDPIRTMTGMKIQNCQEKLFGNLLCRNQAIFTLTIMFIMDLVLFFLDTFLWYIIWNTVYSIARSFMLGLSIWTPWRDIFARLPKQIYSKILATSDLEVRYKPKVLVSQIWNAIIISRSSRCSAATRTNWSANSNTWPAASSSLSSMQRYSKFNKEEHENAEFLLRAYPELQIAYLEEEPCKDGGEPRLYSALIDGHSEFNPQTGRRKPKFRIELPGNPILGDGKSDNQNHAIIFYRGDTYSSDANQDNYLEECLKIRNVLAEFEEYSVSSQSPYAQWGEKEFKTAPVGAREYIFSENISILGDIAAGKEQTFGTLTARSLAWIGGKLHYGHPDFFNATRPQKGLHLNEDIYAGMNAFGCGGRIKHTEYYQCGKGCDLGFGTILNFQTKIGTSMGEQMLSREYYYLGTQLPIDRFLTFYYGHPGFHINTCSSSLVFLGTLNSQLAICRYSSTGQPLNGQGGCYNLHPVFNWIHHCIISIFLVFMIAFLPLFMQELIERGTGRALAHLSKQFMSFSPVFEVFSTQIYTHLILNNLTFGGARYIATSRGFATSRISFSILFSRFAGPSIYLGMRAANPPLRYPLVLDAFLFADFIIDYREFLRWMSRGNSRSHNNSWIGYCHLSRTMITGYKKKKLSQPSEKLSGDVPRAGWCAVIISEVFFPIFFAFLLIVAYMFVKSFPVSRQTPP
ncbi:1,3-beta-glucan synthase component-domain-containing protein [Lactarius sanguifluus]|nr:1,3-beta-glucan synthase component-domain-containing protein [Lactarius sanguifluus]